MIYKSKWVRSCIKFTGLARRETDPFLNSTCLKLHRSYFKTPIPDNFFSLEKNFICFSVNLNRKKAISLTGVKSIIFGFSYNLLQKVGRGAFSGLASLRSINLGMVTHKMSLITIFGHKIQIFFMIFGNKFLIFKYICMKNDWFILNKMQFWPKNCYYWITPKFISYYFYFRK